MNLLDVCRICLLTDENSDMQLLFKDFPEESIIQKIELCGGIKLEKRDDLHSKICSQCLFSLNISYDFRSLCQGNDLKLRNIRLKEKVEIKDEPQSDRASLLASPDPSNHSVVFNEPTCEITEEIEYPAENSISEKKSPEIEEKPKPKEVQRRKRKPKEMQICELCGNAYSRPSQLKLHMRRHAAEKPYSCEMCEGKFTSQSELNRHMRVHTGVRPFKCKYCDRKFSDLSLHIRHERTHTNERPFECATCGKAFAYSNVLKNHMLTHTGEKRFKCEVCDKTFSRPHQLKQHILTITHQQKEGKTNFENKED